MNKRAAIFAWILGLSVALGAFGAHGLKGKISAEALQTYQTGIQYLVIHALGGLFLSRIQLSSSIFHLLWIGMILFTGSLLLVSTRELIGIEALKNAGIITPFGGLSWISAWIISGWQLYKNPIQ